MQSRDNASAARIFLILLGIGAVLLLVVCVVIALAVSPIDDGDDEVSSAPTVSGAAAAASTSATGDPLIFSVIEVGQGACVVVITPDGRTLVADSGRSGERAERVIVPYLESHGVERIDYLVATNPDQDHIGGMWKLLELMPVGTWVDPVVPSTNQAYARALEMVDELGIDVLRARRGGTLDLGPSVTATILWPEDPLVMDGSEVSRNDNSVVIHVQYGDVSFLIPGDIEDDAEELLVEQDDDEGLRSTIYVTPHHGSRTSSTAEFLDAVSPEVALIPVGLDNQYGHPHDEVVQRLRFRGIEIYRTDLDGTIEVTTDGRGYSVETLGTEPEP